MVVQIYVDTKACENILAELLINWLKGNYNIKYKMNGNFKKKYKVFYNVNLLPHCSLQRIKKGEQSFTFFCPKSTMNLTYLCYGGTNLCLFQIIRIFIR
jgi:hypothetical protein